MNVEVAVPNRAGWQLRCPAHCFYEKDRKKLPVTRSFPMMPIMKKVRLVFYMLATVELVLASIVWGTLALQ